MRDFQLRLSPRTLAAAVVGLVVWYLATRHGITVSAEVREYLLVVVMALLTVRVSRRDGDPLLPAGLRVRPRLHRRKDNR